jgi:hypothetical protein
MTFQISKLKAWAVQSQIVSWVIAAVLWLQDLYIDTLALINRAWIYTLVSLICLATRLNRSRERIIYATSHKSGADITLAIKCYYACDKVKSCGSLYRWMAKFGEVDPQINLVIANIDHNYICAARINIDDEVEELTSKPLDDLCLEDLPTIILHRVASSRPEKFTPVKENVIESLHDSSDDYHQKMCDHDD